MRALTESEIRAAFVNAAPEELDVLELPPDFLLVDWDFLDFFAWADPVSPRRGYVVLEHEGEATGIVLNASSTGRGRAGMCNICRTMQPGTQVGLYSARRAGVRGRRGDSIGTYLCADFSCHDNVRLAHPLAPNEVRSPGQIDHRLDGTRRRLERFVAQICHRGA